MEGAFDWEVIWRSRQVLWDGLMLSFKLFGIALATVESGHAAPGTRTK